MGFKTWYDETVVPKIITYGCSQAEVGALRQQVVPLATGNVLEMGCGGGLNQPYYNHGKITGFAGIDPNMALLEGARKRAKEAGWEADIRRGVGEAIPFDNATFDTVVCTYTLCSVDNHARVLAEMRRVLKPGGSLLFLEHGRSPDGGVVKWQRRIEPVWKRLTGNCHLSREIGAAIRGAGFSITPIGQEYLARAPKVAGWMEWGSARKLAE